MPRLSFIPAVAISTISLLCAGCDAGYTNSPKPTFTDVIGRPCTVQFRRDALGAAADLPVPPRTNVINGAEVSVRGKLTAVTAHWIAIQREAEVMHIPLDAVLLVSCVAK